MLTQSTAQTLSSTPTDKFRAYTSDEIPGVWDMVVPHIFSGLAHDPENQYSSDDIYAGLISSKMQLWTWGEDAALVTTIQSDTDKTWCLLLVCGGKDMRDWLPYRPYVEAFARLNGATELRIYGRPGWARAAGFKIDYARMSRCLQGQET